MVAIGIGCAVILAMTVYATAPTDVIAQAVGTADVQEAIPRDANRLLENVSMDAEGLQQLLEDAWEQVPELLRQAAVPAGSVLAAALLCGIILLSGCGGKTAEEAVQPEPVEVTAPAEPEVDEETLAIQDFFEKHVDTKKRPVAVMVDNDDKNARPQAGLEGAYLIYEMVVEGGATRFMALFMDDSVEKIGPVRSSRHYFLDFAKENDVIYTHFGWSPKAANDIPALGVNNINGIEGSESGVFWRERKYQGDWHSAYTSMAKINERAKNKGYNAETENRGGVKYSDKYITLNGENKADSVYMKYSDRYNTGYKYNGESGLCGSRPSI